jgi:DNA replicative helicase MCM subunit Mcm2 (Cdc46/Mcm family)
MNDHPITPPPELVQQWSAASPIQSNDENWAYELFIAHRAAQWGADQELEACLRLVEIDAGEDAYDFARYIRAARRPKPPSFKEQALEMLENAWEGGHISNKAAQTIRRALEALPND